MEKLEKLEIGKYEKKKNDIRKIEIWTKLEIKFKWEILEKWKNGR